MKSLLLFARTRGARLAAFGSRSPLAVLLPALLLLLIVFNPPHQLDLRFSHLLCREGRWIADTQGWFEILTHDAPKFITFAVLIFAACLLVFNALTLRQRKNQRGDRRKALLEPAFARDLAWGFLAALLSLVLVWWLKRTTGVACPWDTTPFGGDAAITSPVWGFVKLAGNCWPAGHAGTGFALFGLAVALYRHQRKAGRIAICVVAAYGLFCGFARVAQGAHFASHVLATGLIDWLMAAAVFGLADFAARRRRRAITASAQAARQPHFSASIRSTPLAERDALASPKARRLFDSAATAALFSGVWWTAVFNASFISAAAAGSPLRMLLIGAAFCAISTALIGVLSLMPRIIYKSLLVALHLVGAAAATALMLYGTVMTPDMVRNFLSTDPAEAAAYLSARTALLFLSLALPPIAVTVLSRAPAAGLRAILKRGAWTLASLVLGLAFLLSDMQGFAGAMRADKTLRYRIAPVNVLWSAGATLISDRNPDAVLARVATDPQARIELSAAASAARSPLFVVVIGETARAANWSLSGYARPTAEALDARAKTPEFVNLPAVVACGTSTDVSLPCMLSRIGRSDYDRKRILNEEALPMFLQRAGADVLWLDNQSGCKGTCTGVPTRKLSCPPGEPCLDGALVKSLREVLAEEGASPTRPSVVFLHMMGSHGPAYADRSPQNAKRWTPECRDANLNGCPRETVVNAYDNSLRYSAQVLEDAISVLDAASREGRPTALLFMSDHGESLGEKGLYLHGAPYFMAPDEQTVVPGLLWISKAWTAAFGDDPAAFRANASRTTHEHLWSTVLGLLKVKSTTYRAEYDLGAKLP